MEYPFLMEGIQRGVLTVNREGNRTQVRVLGMDDGRGVCRGAAVGTAGRLSLGVLVPENGMLHAMRSLSPEAMAAEGIGEVLRGEGWISYRFPQGEKELPEGWQPAERAGSFFRDPVLAAATKQLSGAMIRRAGGRLYLAVPWKPELPFQLTPLFCFASIRPVGAERCAVFALDRDGRPVMERETKKEGA
jgi:hypothetical protein